MEFLDLINIAGQFMELENPTSAAKILTIGKYLGLREGSWVLDFGCGFAEPLVLWAEEYGITAVGVEVREYACTRARQKVTARGLADRIEIVHTAGEDYRVDGQQFDAVTCLGATFIWGGYQQTIRAMRRALCKGGRLGIGEQYWLSSSAPPTYVQHESSTYSEVELLQFTRQEGFDVERIVRASHEDWDAYEGGRWHGLIRWLEENPHHADRAQVIERLRSMQEEYLRFGREYLGWAIYVLAPVTY